MQSRWLAIGLGLLPFLFARAEPNKILSHPPLRVAPPPAERAMGSGPAFFVDATRGDDGNDGSKDSPWKTIQHAVNRLPANATLYARGGTYYENLYVALQGHGKEWVTIRSYPGEQAVIDGGLREFFEAPAEAWESARHPHMAADPTAQATYRSVRRYPNLRNVMGSFGDSMVGLSTYFHLRDLCTENELWHWEDWEKRSTTDCAPLYCGPGLWYDRGTGYIYVRLARTNITGATNYRGERDPRKVPLVIAPFNSVPVHMDHATHFRLQDLVIRGAGYNAVILNQCSIIIFDNVTIWCGTYGMRTINTRRLKFYRSALYGNCPPWLFRSDTSKRAYPGRPHRDITRLNTHSNWVVGAGREFSVFATPMNDAWSISYSDFTDAHDGPYFGGVGVGFHHNLVEGTQDDGIYLSQMYPRHLYMRGGAESHIYQNVFRGTLTALAFGGCEDSKDTIYIYRNIFDLRDPIYTARPSTKRATVGTAYGRVMSDHGSPPWPTMMVYHNTVLSRGRFIGVGGHTSPERPRTVFNNIFVHLDRLPGVEAPLAGHGQGDGNLYWSPKADLKKAAGFFNRYRAKNLEKSKEMYAPGSTSNSRLGDPKFVKVGETYSGEDDFRIAKGSQAVDAGVDLPEGCPDPLRETDKGKPDLGALPSGAAPLHVGRAAAPAIE